MIAGCFHSAGIGEFCLRNGAPDDVADWVHPNALADHVSWDNGKLRDECLNEHWFRNLHQAQKIISAWRRDYNEQRPHSSLDYLTPAEFAVNQRQQSIDFLEHQVNE